MSLLVESTHTLLQSSITKKDLQKKEYDLHQLVYFFESIYGKKHMTFNVHGLKYLVDCIRYSGPVWANSIFLSGNAIYYLEKCVHGPKGVYDQMAEKTIQTNIF